MATETHVAGLQMDVQGRYLLQRCGWCGAVLAAYDRTRIAVAGDTYRDPSLYPVGQLVRFSYDGVVAQWGTVALARTTSEVLPDTDTLPKDACALQMPFEVVAPRG